MPPARPSDARSPLRAPFRGIPRALRLGLLGLGATLAGCYLSDAGLPPPTNVPYFPTSLAVSKGRTTLYVVNSDFDLQYNAGTVEAFDLAKLRPELRGLSQSLNAGKSAGEACAAANLDVNSNEILSPGPCTGFPLPYPSNSKRNTATIGAFATDSVLVQNPNDEGARLFITVRGDPSITWFDLVDDRKSPGASPCADGDLFCIQCGQDPTTQRCDDSHRIGLDPDDNLRFLTLPVEPQGIDASDDTRALVVAHQTTQTVSLSENLWATGANGDTVPQRPVLQYYLGNLGVGPTAVAHIPRPALVVASAKATSSDPDSFPPMTYDPSFLVTYNQTAELDLFGYHDDGTSSPRRPFLTRTSITPVNVNSSGKDSRGITIDPTDRQLCEAACAASDPPTQADLDCLAACVEIPLGLYIANRAPPSLIVGRVRSVVVDSDAFLGTQAAVIDTPEIIDTVPLAQGPSRTVLGQVINSQGVLERRIFSVTFDSRFVYSYDPVAQRVDSVIYTGRGPHGIAFDVGHDAGDDDLHAYLYVGHFTDSYLGVVDLDMRHITTFGTMFASVGTPVAPRESKP